MLALTPASHGECVNGTVCRGFDNGCGMLDTASAVLEKLEFAGPSIDAELTFASSCAIFL
jgi:hypothetical protein